MMSAEHGPPAIQLAIQGGGAKICLLVAALEAVQTLEREKRLRVSRIAGTSAGAAVGCLFAAGVDMKVVREHLKAKSPEDIKRLFSPPSRLALLRHLYRGVPFWDQRLLENILVDLLKSADVQEQATFEDIKKKRGIDVHVVATSLTDSGKKVYMGPDRIVSSVMDSCGLPFCFRTWSRAGSAVIVDGGICENLPSEELERYPDDGSVVAISFGRTGRSPVTDILSFSKALLDAAINNSMDRARLRLGEPSVFSINTDIGTFDWERAHKSGLTESYENVKTKAENFFREFVSPPRQDLVGDPWKTQSIDLMDRLGRVHQAQSGKKCEFEVCSMLVQANSLMLSGGGDSARGRDLLRYSLQFRAHDSVYCRSMGLSTPSHTSPQEKLEKKVDWRIKDLTTSKEINAVGVPIRSPLAPRGQKLLLFFDPILRPQAGPYKLDLQEWVDDCMKPLRTRGRDEITFEVANARGQVGRIDLILWCPIEFGSLTMKPKKYNVEQGRAMTEHELSAYGDPPPSFRAIGWTGEHLEPNKVFGVDVTVGPS